MNLRSLPAKKKTQGARPRRPRAPDGAEASDLRARVLDLEARVRALAVSRRVLINLLVSTDRKRKLEVARLRTEVEKLRNRNRTYSRALAARRLVIDRLRRRLEDAVGEVPQQTGPC